MRSENLLDVGSRHPGGMAMVARVEIAKVRYRAMREAFLSSMKGAGE